MLLWEGRRRRGPPRIGFMKPIEDRADTAYMEALRCVSFRIPNPDGLSPVGYALALGLRYGLLGIAATHHLFLSSEPSDETEVLAFIRSWPLMVEEHIRGELAPDLPIPAGESFCIQVSHYAHEPLRQYLGMWRQGVPLERCLSLAVERFVVENESAERRPWHLFHRRGGNAQFRVEASKSLLYAMHFFERREYGLPEVREIALLGE